MLFFFLKFNLIILCNFYYEYLYVFFYFKNFTENNFLHNTHSFLVIKLFKFFYNIRNIISYYNFINLTTLLL